MPSTAEEADRGNQRAHIPEKDDLALEKVHLDKSSGANPFPATGKAQLSEDLEARREAESLFRAAH